jgi:single-strand DNA-binding protein
MACMNRVTLVGYLGKDPESRTTPQGRMVTKFSLATTERWKGKNGDQNDRTDWHHIVMWGRSAEVASEYLKKGDCCLVEGKIRYHFWDDEGGKRHYRTDIEVDRFQLLPGKNVAGTAPAGLEVAELPAEELPALPADTAGEEMPF